MKFASCLIFCLVLIITAGGALAQTRSSAATEQESYTLNIYSEGGGRTVLMQDLIDLIRTLAPKADVDWDVATRTMSVNTDTRRIKALADEPVVLINSDRKAVSRPVLVRDKGVYIPIETVQVIFDALGVNFDIKDNNGSSPTPAPSSGRGPAVPLAGTPEAQPPAAPPSVPIATPSPAVVAPSPTPIPATPVPQPSGIEALLPTSSTSTTVAAVTPAAPTVPTRILQSYPAKPQGDQAPGTPLQPPVGVLAGKIGLTWAQLADSAHRKPPQRITVVHDGEFAALGARLVELLRQSDGLEVSLVAVNTSRRDSGDLVLRVADTRPDLVIDLMNSPLASSPEDGQTFTVWTAHDALWPQDREAAARSGHNDTTRYRRHQFQSMALGSLLKSKLLEQYKNQPVNVTYQLAPSYLLRRLDNPAAAVLVPKLSVDGDEAKRVGDAITAAVSEYVHGMMRFSTAR